MKYLMVLLLSLPGWHWLTHIRAYNEAIAHARATYQQGNAATAAKAYGLALTAYPAKATREPTLLLNLAHAQSQAGQLEAAKATYGQLLTANAIPPALGSTARQQLAVIAAGQGQYAQALSLLRQALLLNSANTTARYNYEVLRYFLAQQPAPQMPPPASNRQPQKSDTPATRPTTPPPPSPNKDNSAAQSQPALRPGTDRRGEVDAPRPGAGSNPTQPRESPDGQHNPDRPNPNAGNSAAGGYQPGQGEKRPLPTGTAGGNQRGLTDAAPGETRPASRRDAGTEQATGSDLQFQTQRDRLRQLNLTPAQARQLLEALRAQEEQYLQQKPRPAGKPPRKGEPTW